MKSVDSKLAEIGARLNACEKTEAPLLEILQSGEAMLGLEGFGQWKANLEKQKKLCVARLDGKEDIAEAPCEGDNWFPGCDPNVTQGDARPTGEQVTRARDSADAFQRPAKGERGDSARDGQSSVVSLPTGYTGDVEAEVPTVVEEAAATREEEGVITQGGVIAGSIADEFGSPTLPERPPRTEATVPAAPPAATAPATSPQDRKDETATAATTDDPCKSQGAGCRSAPDGKGCVCPETAQKPPPVTKPREKYGVFLLFDNKSAIWVGPESRLQNRASGTVKYGGMCRDVKECPVVYSMKEGPFDTEEEANKAYCDDLEAGPWWSLGVRRVRMNWRENAYAASKVPSCQ
jgi:hypothetical protein